MQGPSSLVRGRRVILAGIAVLLSACSGGGAKVSVPTAPVVPILTTVNVSLSVATIQVGQTATASAAGLDQNGAAMAMGIVSWSTGSNAIATITSGGVITAVAPGQVSVVATVGARSGQQSITVIQASVASVTISAPTMTLAVGKTQQLTASTNDANGNALVGRVVSWASSNPSIALVSSFGLVTAISVGNVTITAASEGKSATSTVTVVAPVASVVITGSLQPKVGDTYSYSATASLANGTVVIRPVTWSILEATKGIMTPSGSLTPSQTGTITLQANIDGSVWVATVSAYDWMDLSSGGSIRAGIISDTPITNKYGTSEFPMLTISCTSSGYFFMWVTFANFITQSGLVAYGFDGGTISSAMWTELGPSYNTLWHPGPNTLTKSFAVTMSGARTFGFAFTEFNSSAKAMIFRVTGLAARLSPIIAACPGAAILADASSLRSEQSSIRGTTVAVSSAILADRQSRQLQGPRISIAPALIVKSSNTASQTAVRRPW